MTLGFVLSILAAMPAQQACDPFEVAPNYQVRFELDVAPYLGTDPAASPRFCSNCHTGGGSAGGLSFDAAEVRYALVGQNEQGTASTGYDGWRRIVPGRPYESLVFVRTACGDAPGGRMPPFAPNPMLAPDFARFQALLHDWIKLGAIFAGGDRTFVGDFESLR